MIYVDSTIAGNGMWLSMGGGGSRVQHSKCAASTGGAGVRAR
jgi:hypothetical protein